MDPRIRIHTKMSWICNTAARIPCVAIGLTSRYRKIFFLLTAFEYRVEMFVSLVHLSNLEPEKAWIPEPR
jgi:hypothetical protein